MIPSMRALALASSGFALFVLGCAANPQPCSDVPTAETSPPSEVASSPPESPPEAAETPAPPPAPAAEAPKPEPKPEPKAEPKPAEKPAAPEPVFADGSVADAIKAVPVGSERANIDQETLSVPIKDFAVYEPCKPGAAHIKMKIAIWDGKAVGIDVTTTPKNEKLATCIKSQVRTLTWKAHVKSLNTVEYSF